MSVRSLLFTPGSDARKLERALSSSADAVVCDLEDAVAPADKESARDTVARALTVPHPHPGRGVVPPPSPETVPAKGAPVSDEGTTNGDDSATIPARPRRLVRVNAVDTQWFEEDIELAAGLELDAIVLPKSSPEAVAALGPDGQPIVALIETANGVRQAYEIARGPRVAALVLGAVDLGAQVGLEPRPDAQEILYPRAKVAIDSAAAGLRGPFDVVHLDLHDQAGLEEECRLARALGFRGKACIHPGQIETINRLFSPSEQEVEWARGIVEAFEGQNEGVLAVNGTMVDKPVVDRARRILQEAGGSVR
jgi:citrate lyase subunit beta/citryl-CoA lyase